MRDHSSLRRILTSPWLLAALSGLAFVAIACRPEGLMFPRDAVEFSPPTYYRTLWRSVESCSGSAGDYASVRWFRTDGSAGGDVDAIGAWWPEGNRIVLNGDYLNNESIIRHEMLHAILRSVEHLSTFNGSCADIVSCSGRCTSEAGTRPPGPTATSPIIQPSALVVSAELIPPTSLDSGWTTLIVTATNPHPYAVWVDLDGRPGIQFDCYFDTSFRCGGRNYLPEEDGPFGANETRREASVFRLSPGSRSVVGFYNTVATPAHVVSVPQYLP
jgi:hypothetical protein